MIVSEAAGTRAPGVRLLRVRARRRAARRRVDRDRRSRRRLLPARGRTHARARLQRHARTLMRQYELDHPPDTLVPNRPGRRLAEVIVPALGRSSGGRLPGHGHRQRRPRRARRAAAGEDARRDEHGSRWATCCSCEGTWSALDEHPTTPRCSWWTRRPRPPAGGPARARARERALAVLAAMVAPARDAAPSPAAVAGAARRRRDRAPRVVTAEQAYRGSRGPRSCSIAGYDPRSPRSSRVRRADGRSPTALVDAVGDAGPYVLLVALFVLTVAFGQLISNTATALIVIPDRASPPPTTWTSRPRRS